ncbi:MAG TPA: L,D-transpeptidase family protein [Verrucomicrobiales bacterium]|nr:L,D-transpeptidase family protein [Verrucomicrobiales bacterium]
MTCRRLLTIILAAVGISFLCSCSLVPEVQRAFGGHGSYWRDTHKGGKAWMEVDLRRQVATFYRGRNKMGVSAISSGDERHRTPDGNYRVLEKLRVKYSGSYGHVEDARGRVVNINATPRSRVPAGGRYVPAPMPYWMRLTSSGIGMHQGFLPGYAASHGCIRMDKKVVRHFYSAAYVGMRVRIKGG